MSEIKNGPLDQYGAGPFEQQQFGTAGVEGVETVLRPGLLTCFEQVTVSQTSS